MSKETKMNTVSAESRAVMGELLAAFEQFKQANDQRLAEIETRAAADVLLEDKLARIDAVLDSQKSALDRLVSEAGRPGLASGGEISAASAGFTAYMRRGESHEGKSLTAGVSSEGGHVVPVETEARIDRLLAEASPIRAIATVRQTAAGVFRKPVSRGGAATGWVSEAAARPETDAPSLELIEFPAAELYAMPAATQQLLDDAMVDVEDWLATEVRDVFAAQESAAFIAGDGINKPRGLLDYTAVAEGNQAWGELGYVATGTSGGFDAADPADALIDLIYAPRTAYRAKGRFVMNRQTVSAVIRFNHFRDFWNWAERYRNY